MTMIRSSSGMNRETAPNRTSLPVPVPPEMMMFFRSRTQMSMNSLAAGAKAAEGDQVVERKDLLGEPADRQIRPGPWRWAG